MAAPATPGGIVVEAAWALRVLVARRRLAAGIFLSILALTVAATAAVEPRYESGATLVAVQERDTTLALLKSDDFRARVADRLRAEGHETDAGELDGAVRVSLGFRRTVNEEQSLVRILAAAPEGPLALATTQAYLAELEASRPILEDAHRARVWPTMLAAANGDASVARERVDALVAGTTYSVLLDAPALPARPSAPVWPLNLALGAAFAAAAALVCALGAETYRATRPAAPPAATARPDPRPEDPVRP